MVNKEEKVTSIFSPNKLSTKSKALIHIEKLINESHNPVQQLESSDAKSNNPVLVESDQQEDDKNCEIVDAKK